MFGITLNALISEYGEENILEAYNIPINSNISSPVRDEPDNHPSFRVYRSDNGIIWKDFAMTQKEFGIVSLLQHIEKCRDEKELVKKVLSQIKDKKQFFKKEFKSPDQTTICGLSYKKHWEDYEQKFWLQGDMTPSFLMDNLCFPVATLYFNYKPYWRSCENHPTYGYIIDQDSNSFQCYRPYNEKGRKHFSWNISDKLFGKKLITHFDHLVITSSYKDILTLKKINVQAVCSSGEATIIKDKKIEILKKRFKKLYVMLNNDLPGRKAQKRYTDLGLKPINIPINYPKDPWDIITKFNNYNKLKQILYDQTSIL